MIIKHFNYSEFKQNFYRRVKSPDLFEISDVNYLKVILENLVVRYSLKWKVRPYIFYSAPGLFLLIKRIVFNLKNKNSVQCFNSFLQSYKTRKYDYLLIDNGRKLLNREGKNVSTYFHNIRQHLSKHNVSFLHYLQRVNGKAYEDEFDDGKFREYIYLRSLNTSDKKLISDLKLLFRRVKQSGLFNEEEIKHIEGGLTVFFQNYRLWDFYIKLFRPKTVLLLGHYHNEGLILACKKNNVKVIELQHGLIAEEDIFYVTPKIFAGIKDKALFPDQICTYGKYWTEVLRGGNEFSASQIKEIGYYLFEDSHGSEQEEKMLIEFTESCKIVLVTSQPALHESFVEYVSRWVQKLGNSNVRFVLKLHPADKEEWYDSLKKYSNVLVTRIRLEVLFRYCDVHLTSYSTTLYDAFRYKVRNYSVNFPECADYVASITEKGISTLLQENEFPELNAPENNNEQIVDSFFMKPEYKILLT